MTDVDVGSGALFGGVGFRLDWGIPLSSVGLWRMTLCFTGNRPNSSDDLREITQTGDN